MNGLLRQSAIFCKQNASTILTCIGGVGVVATTIMAVKATPKAMTLLEKAEKEKGEELTKLEKIKVAGPTYISTILVGGSTIACIFGSNILNKQHQAALISAYALVDNSFKEYKKKLKELHGDEAHEEIVNAIAVEKAEKTYIHADSFCNNCNLALEEISSKEVLFYEEFGNRYFTSTIEQVMNAEYHLNRNYILRGYSYLNELYEFLGIEGNDYGSVLGWAPNDEGMYWIDFNHRKATMNDGTEFYILEMPFEPTYDFLEY